MNRLLLGVILEGAAILVQNAEALGRVGNCHDSLVAPDIERAMISPGFTTAMVQPNPAPAWMIAFCTSSRLGSFPVAVVTGASFTL